MSSSNDKIVAEARQPKLLLPTATIDVLHLTGWCNQLRYVGEATIHDQDGALRMLMSTMSLLNVEPTKVEGILSSCPLSGKNIEGGRAFCNASIKPPSLTPHNPCLSNNTPLVDTMTRPQTIAMFNRFGFLPVAQAEIYDSEEVRTLKDMAKMTVKDVHHFCQALRSSGAAPGTASKCPIMPRRI